MKALRILGWIAMGLLILAGIFTFVFLFSYRFTGCIFFAMAGVVLCYEILSFLKKSHRKTAKLLALILTTCIGLGIVAASATGLYIASAAIATPPSGCEYVVVLGAGVNGTVPSMSLQERIDGAYAYLKQNPNTICIVSGGQGPREQITEAQCMYDQLVRMGIAPTRIWKEEASTSTKENLSFSLQLIEQTTGKKVSSIGIVSSEYHVFRAGIVARQLGVESVGIPAHTARPGLRINYFLREIAAVWYYVLLGGSAS